MRYLIKTLYMHQRPVSDPQVDIYRRMKPWQRLDAARQLYWFAREIIMARERRAHPRTSETELNQRVRTYFK